MVLNKDFREFIELLNQLEVRYLVIGGYAVALHGYPRYTKDLDIWIWVSEQNAQRMVEALRKFGFGGLDISAKDFLEEGSFVHGYPPNRIDILTSCDGVSFEECYAQKVSLDLSGICIDFRYSDNFCGMRVLSLV